MSVVMTSIRAGIANIPGVWKLPEALMKFNNQLARIAGLIRTNVTLSTTQKFFAPDIRAASSRDGFKDFNAAVMMRNASGNVISTSTKTIPSIE
jgi:hypothetical protein